MNCSHYAAAALLLMLIHATAVEADDTCKSAAGTSDRVALRKCLDPSYSLLYQEAQALPKLHWLLMFKKESDSVDILVSSTLDYYKQLSDQLEKLARDDPGVDIHLKPMPDILSRAREALGEDQLKQMRPLVGEGGKPFERDLLLMLRDMLDEQRHIVSVMLADETAPDLKHFLQETRAGMDGLYQRYDQLLAKRYFAQPEKQTMEPAMPHS